MVCNRCQTKGLSTECVVEPPKPRKRGIRSNSIDNSSLLPSKSGNQSSRRTVNNHGSSTQRQRSNSDTASQSTNHPAKKLRLTSQSSHSRQSALNSIAEEDESLADTLVPDFNTTERNHTRLVGKTQFFDALTGTNDNDEGSGGSDSDMEDFEEEIDISSGGGSSEDEEEDQSVKQWHLQITKSIKSQSCGSTKSRRTKREQNMKDTQAYDPSTCRKWPLEIQDIA